MLTPDKGEKNEQAESEGGAVLDDVPTPPDDQEADDGTNSTQGGDDKPEGDQGDTASSFTIGFAQAAFDGLYAPTEFDDALRKSWRAGTEITRYGRHWTLSKMLSEDNGGYYGKIGFVNSDQLETLAFDQETLDFVRGQAPSGVVVPFVIAQDGLISYQLISGIVRDNSFIGALEALLNAGANVPYTWTITPVAFPINYNEWRKSVDRVSRFDIKLERPNPHYHGDVIAEQLVEELRTEYVRLSGVERNSETGVDTDSDVFRQALDHVLRNYGEATLTGVDSEGARSVFVKVRNAASRLSARVRVSATTEGPEVPEQALRAARASLPVAVTTSKTAEESAD
ncbi:hypothetical protein [Mycobacterium sp. AT1]|uniref:hypothetical protein n=1 Tax=Mycobacterium sp. AT1 TaxID=1961706 RepID=UPI001151F24B|nr:hypothetical protein [Mycobacterium sp. AT1]